MTLDQIVAAHHAKQEVTLAAIRKGISGHPDALPINVQCGDLATLISMLDEARAAVPPAPAPAAELASDAAG